MRLGAVERRLAARSGAFRQATLDIAEALEAVCSTPSHPDHFDALEIAEFLSHLSPRRYRTGDVETSGLSDGALRFSIRLFQSPSSLDKANI